MKVKDKSTLSRIKRKIEGINAMHTIKTNESNKDKERRIKRLLGCYTAFVEYYFAHIAKKGTVANFHRDIAEEIQKNDRCRLNLQISRGFAKTTTANLFIPIWLMLRKEMKFMVLVGRNEESGQRLLGEIRDELMLNPRLISDFGKFFEREAVSTQEFTTNQGVKFFCLGRGQSPRGVKGKHSVRPDYLTIDDASDDTIVKNPKRAQELYDWVREAYLGTMATGQGRFICAENTYSKHCLSSYLKDNPGFKTITINALNEKEESNWPEVYSTEQIMDHRRTIGEVAFKREYCNTPVQLGKTFKAEWLEKCEVPKISEYEHIILYTDPSFSLKGDHKAIAIVGIKKAVFYILDVFVRKTSLKAMFDYIEKKYFEIPKMHMFIEASFMQNALIDKELKERESVIPLRKDKRKKTNKQYRVEQLTPLFERGQIKINKDITHKEDYKEFEIQLLGFEPGSRLNDDAPDALEGAVSLLQKRAGSRHRGIGGFRVARRL